MNFFQDAHGNFSSLRLIFVFGTLWNMLITTYLILGPGVVLEAISFFSAIEGILAGLKLGQKPMEKPKTSTTVK